MAVKVEEAIETGLHLTSIGLAIGGLVTGLLPLAGIGIALEGVALLVTAARLADESMTDNAPPPKPKLTNPTKSNATLFAKHPQAMVRSVVTPNVAPIVFPGLVAAA